MIVKDSCRINGVACPNLEKVTGKSKSKFWYRCLHHSRPLSSLENCEFAGDFEKQIQLFKSETKGVLTMAEKMKQTLIELKQKVGDLLEAEWDNLTEAYVNHEFSLSANIKIIMDGESTNVVGIQPILSFYPMPKTEIKSDKFTVDEKQKKLFEN